MRYLFLSLVGLIATSVLAQSPINSFPPGMFTSRNDPAPYTGPGDIQPGATAFYSLRAYSRAYALPGTNVAVNIKRNSDSHACDLLIKSTGDLGNTVNCGTGGDNGQTALSFLGIHATATCTTSGTTIACTGATVTPSGTNFDMVSGTGITGLYLVACGAFTGGAGSCTMNAPAAANISSPEAISFVNLGLTHIWYDQSGNGSNDTAVSDLAFNPIGHNGTLPIIIVGGGNFGSAAISSTSLTYYTSVAVRQVGLTTQYGIIGTYDDTTTPNGSLLYFPPSNNQVDLLSGGLGFASTGSDLTLHALQGLINGASSLTNVDGTETTGTTAAAAAATRLCVGLYGHAGGCSTAILQGSYSEMGAWAATPNGTVRTSMCNNMRVYWGTPGSC